MTDRIKNSFYKAGQTAYCNGLDKDLCPLICGKLARQMWLKGWQDAENIATKFGYFERVCRNEANRQWGHAGLVDEHFDLVQVAFGLSQTPEAFVRWLGEREHRRPVEQSSTEIPSCSAKSRPTAVVIRTTPALWQRLSR
jgi:ribosome modulation factor